MRFFRIPVDLFFTWKLSKTFPKNYIRLDLFFSSYIIFLNGKIVKIYINFSRTLLPNAGKKFIPAKQIYVDNLNECAPDGPDFLEEL